MSVTEREAETLKPAPSEATEPTIPSLVGPLRRSRRWPWLLLGSVIGAGAVLAVGSVVGEINAEPEAETDSTGTGVALATVAVTRQDLIEEVEWDGQLGYGDAQIITGSGGTITAAAEVGAVVERGDALLSVDGQPVVAFYGSTPPYRTMAEGAAGADVQQLETNLIALGYDPDGTVTIDEEFTAYTEAMVERWQEDLGLEATGTVEVDDIVVLGGPSIVRSSATPGASAAGQLATVAATIEVVDTVEDGVYVGSSEQGRLVATVMVDVTDADEFASDDSVTIEQADESLLAGLVTHIGTEVTTTNDGTSSVEIMIAVDPAPVGLSAEPIEGAVVIHTVGSQVLDALVVPTRSLVSLKEGGFAVETVTGPGETSLVGIELGVFDDGMVEVTAVTAGSLTEGDEIVVPQ